MKGFVAVILAVVLVFSGAVFTSPAVPDAVSDVAQKVSGVQEADAQGYCFGNWGSTYRNNYVSYAMTTYTNVTCPTGAYVWICIVESGDYTRCNQYYVAGNMTISKTCYGTAGYGRSYWGYIADRNWNVIGTNASTWAPVNCTS